MLRLHNGVDKRDSVRVVCDQTVDYTELGRNRTAQAVFSASVSGQTDASCSESSQAAVRSDNQRQTDLQQLPRDLVSLSNFYSLTWPCIENVKDAKMLDCCKVVAFSPCEVKHEYAVRVCINSHQQK